MSDDLREVASLLREAAERLDGIDANKDNACTKACEARGYQKDIADAVLELDEEGELSELGRRRLRGIRDG